MNEIVDELEYKKAKRYAYRRLAAQNVCSNDLIRLLSKKLFSKNIIDKIVKELQDLGYINDQAWLESFVRVQQDRKVGPKVMAQKLKLKGFSRDQIADVLHNQSQNEAPMIQALIQKKYASKNLKEYKEKNKVIAALVRKGFSLDEILRVISSFTKRNKRDYNNINDNNDANDINDANDLNDTSR